MPENRPADEAHLRCSACDKPIVGMPISTPLMVLLELYFRTEECADNYGEDE